jgi:hypothetical protein
VPIRLHPRALSQVVFSQLTVFPFLLFSPALFATPSLGKMLGSIIFNQNFLFGKKNVKAQRFSAETKEI